MNRLWFLLLLPFVLFAQQNERQYVSPEQNERQHVPHEQIEKELAEAEAQYEHALELFNPWYTGPLITPSATMVPPGKVNWQPYLYLTDTYGAFNEDRERVHTPNAFSVQAYPVLFQLGITPSVDTAVIMSTVANWKEDQFSGGFNDTTLQIGFMIQKESIHVPKAKFVIGQSFPTGKYQHLDPKNLGLDATGAGAWKTSFNLTFGKVILWNTLHPVNTRISMGYTIPTNVKVRSFNSYGGGYGTNGTVRPGNSFNVDMGLELSINQPWVVALDLAYNCTNRTKFSGNPGTTTKQGSIPASNTSGFSDQFSLAPAVEYNFSDSMGMLGGVWFTVYGRNASNFVSGIFSWYWFFP